MLSPRIKIVSSPTPHFSLQSTPASRHELSARKVETVIHEIHQDIHALLAGTDTERDIFQNRKIALRNALDRLSVLIINMTPTEQRRMLQYWESRNPEFWDTLCILGYDDQ